MLFFFHQQLGLDMEELEEIEEDAGLGNGGLGRLAGKCAIVWPLTPSQMPCTAMLKEPEDCLEVHSVSRL